MKDQISALLAPFGEHGSFVWKDLVTGEGMEWGAHTPHNAASIIKIPVMVELFRRFEDGSACKDTLLPLRDCDRVPPCGVLTFMHEGMPVSLMDLCWLMITISDNMATNMLINYLTVPAIQETMRALGLQNSMLERKLFETDPALRNKRNRISAADMALLLEQMHRGELISERASREMLDVLSGQQLNNKIPFLLPLDMHIAHKTGEVDDVTHDVGIIYAKRPQLVCFCSSDVDAPAFNQVIFTISKLIFDAAGGLVE
ncbi:MAG: hypothetical protein ABT01_00105 [Clostridium sp. SCN 57-10]|nr:MAG: hypothetical protein ABT01_00105 [Clostridium sp. SCN 57-10]